MLGAAQVPAAPGDASSAVAAAWAGLRTSDVPGTAALSPTERATPAGQTYAGFRALRLGDLGSAQSSFGAALAAVPDLPEAQYGMGMTAALQGRSDLAAQWFEASLLSEPGLTRAAVELNRVALDAVAPELRSAEDARAAGDPVAAERHYRSVIARAPFLSGPYIRLAELSMEQGSTAAAIETLESARRALGEDEAILRELGDVYMAEGRYAEAADAYGRLADLRPEDPSAAANARRARDAYERAALPSEYRTLAEKTSLSREELAAVLAINLEALEDLVGTADGVIVADAGDRWTTPFVLRTVRWGVLDVYQNNEFYPRMEVLRSMLVEAAYRVLEIVGAADGAPRPTLTDPPPEHVLYRQVQAVVGLGILEAGADGSFDLLEPVTGREALDAVQTLTAIVRQRGS